MNSSCDVAAFEAPREENHGGPMDQLTSGGLSLFLSFSLLSFLLDEWIMIE